MAGPERARRLCLLFLLWSAFLLPSVAAAELSPHRIEFEASHSSGVVGYFLNVGDQSGEYAQAIDIGAPPSPDPVLIYEAQLDRSRDLYIAMSAYDVNGLTSTVSNEIHLPAIVVTEPTPTPAPEPEPEPTPEPEPEPTPEPEPEPTPTPEPEPTPEPTPDPLPDSTRRLGVSSDATGLILTLDTAGRDVALTLHSAAATGDLRPTRCDLDGDGDVDLALGFGAGSGGEVALVLMQDGAVASVRTFTATTEVTLAQDDETWPACGDVDGDGLSEILVGVREAGRPVLRIFDDLQSDFAPLPGSGGGRIEVPISKRIERRVRSFVPALGDVDGDGRDEIVVGFEGSEIEHITVLDDALEGFTVHRNVRNRRGLVNVAKPHALSVTSAGTYPAVGDWDGDGLDEIAIGVGEGRQGRITMLDDARAAAYRRDGWMALLQVGRSDGAAIPGPVRPAFGELDDDPGAELVVGFGASGSAELELIQDADGWSPEDAPQFIGAGSSIEGWTAAPAF